MVAVTPDNSNMVSVHGRRLGFMGDGQRFSGHSHLWLGDGSKGKVVASTRLPILTVITGVSPAGAVTVSGTNGGAPNVGDLVESVIDLTSSTDASSSFETTISVAGQIQQLTASTHAFLVRIIPQS